MSPRTTIVVTQRKRTALTERSRENTPADKSESFRMTYVGGGASDHIRKYLERRAAEADFLLIAQPGCFWPNEARNLALPDVDTEYVAFVDDDVVVELGCAHETGAALVAPLHLWSSDGGETRIHMAGGALTYVKTPESRALHARHDGPASHQIRTTLETRE